MVQSRLTHLTLMNIHGEIRINTSNIIDHFTKHKLDLIVSQFFNIWQNLLKRLKPFTITTVAWMCSVVYTYIQGLKHAFKKCKHLDSYSLNSQSNPLIFTFAKIMNTFMTTLKKNVLFYFFQILKTLNLTETKMKLYNNENKIVYNIKRKIKK